MTTILDEMEQALTDLLQMGLATAGPELAQRLMELSDRCEGAGLHAGAVLFAEISRLLKERSHSLDKTDLKLTAQICRAEHYITLCRSRMTEDQIRMRWQEGGKT